MGGKRIPNGKICYICGKKAERIEYIKGIRTGKYICIEHYHIKYTYGIYERPEHGNKRPRLKYKIGDICHICKVEWEKEGKELTNDSILRPGNACLGIDKDGKKVDEVICLRHYSRNYNRYNPNSWNNMQKSLSNIRTGNLDSDSAFAKSLKFQKLTCKIYGVDDLNVINDNYNSPIDHNRHPILGILQTEGRLFNNTYTGKNGGWGFNTSREWFKEFDNIILWCANADGNSIEREYIIPKKEIKGRATIQIVKDPKDGHGNHLIPWYEEYRITDKEGFKKINEFWKIIIEDKIKLRENS